MGSVLEFAYDAMKEPSKQIRLCRIRPKVSGSPLDIELEEHHLEDIKYQFAALSYAWGDQESDCQITVNGLALGGSSAVLTRNLYTFLYRLRELQYRELVWIDALCINQFDIEEKQHQVALMGRIFESAEKVLVGLDEANTDFDKAKVDHELVRAVLRQLEQDVHIHKMSDLIGRPLRFVKDCDAVRALCGVSDSTWFERVWVVQEVCLATTSYVLFAGNLLPWTTFRKAFDQLHAHRSEVCCSSIVASLDPEVQMTFHRVRRERKRLMWLKR
jgi:hypothetical protein